MAPEPARWQPAELASAGRQLWETISGWFGRDGDAVSVTLLFTELCGFRSWVLEVGDQRALELLRGVATVVEPCISGHRGRVVKRLGQGHMAVFADPSDAVEAAVVMQRTLADFQPSPDGEAGAHPRLKAGLHRGHPQRIEGDYLGADVNIAARLVEAAQAGEVLVSGEVLNDISPEELERLDVKRRRAFRAKGAPPGLTVFCVAPRGQG